jgi:hypothetical protein
MIIDILIILGLFIFYDIVMYYRIKRLENMISSLYTVLSSTAQQLDKKIEEHKLETRRIS